MNVSLQEVAGRRCLFTDAEGPPIGDAKSISDIVGEALGERAELVVVPVGRLDPAFFQLRSGIAGEFLQKLVNYRLRIAIVGDVSAHVAASNAFRDLVVECERGQDVLFVADVGALERRLAGPS
jgi:hypothetical protein